jgi:hypothetical protein
MPFSLGSMQLSSFVYECVLILRGDFRLELLSNVLTVQTLEMLGDRLDVFWITRWT